MPCRAHSITEDEKDRDYSPEERHKTKKSDKRETQRKVSMTTGSPVEIYLIYSIPIHLAVRSGLHLNYQLAFPKYPSTYEGMVVEDF
jgi:hypothetical protein